MLLRVLSDLLYLRGDTLLKARRARFALWHFAFAARLDPKAARYLGAAALAAEALGARDRAVEYCERALDLDPASAESLRLLAGMFMHGEGYLQVLRRIHEHLRPRSYIEIGVAEGASLALVLSGTLAIGIDPLPALSHPLPPQARLFTETSDAFFARGELPALLGGMPFALAFIDGMHQFEFALRDFINLERVAATGSTILVHDCFPRDRRSAQRERVTEFWSGDLWRFILLLKKYRPDLRIHTIATPPTGLAVIRNLDPSSNLLAANTGRYVEEFMRLDYAMLMKDRASKLNLLPNDWPAIQNLLQARD